MRYLCVHCDEKFELAGEQEPRCPKCMRVHGLRALAATENGSGPSPRRTWIAVVGALAIVAAGGGGFVLWQRQQAEPEPAELARTPLAQSALERALERRGVKAEPLARLLEPDAAIEAFAERAGGNATGADGKARAVVEALQARAAAKAFVTWPLSDPRSEPPLTAAQALSAIAKDGARKQLYPLEVAALAVAALRTLDVGAMVAEVHDVSGERTPVDPAGRFGYFAVALVPEQAGAAPRLFDAYGGREKLTATGHAVLSDIEAVGAALSLRAGARLARNEDPAQALRDADAAVKLLPGSPAVRTQRGTVLLASAASEPGAAELEAAAQIARDPARRNNLAMLHLAKGDTERAAREVSQALAQHPDFALAYVTLAAVQLSSGEREQARTALQRAEALQPELHALALTWAQFHASAGQVEPALSYAERAVKARPQDPQARLLLAGLYRQASRYDDMRREARAVMDRTPVALQSRMRELIGRLLGPTALEVDGDAESTDADRAGDDARQRLELDAPGSAAGSPRLRLDGADPAAPGGGALKAQDGAPTLRLKEPGTGLTLPQP